MMPVATRDATADFVKPGGWDPERDGRCGALSVRRTTHGRFVHHVSTWLPSPEELVILQAGGVIELTCVGVQPPVAMEAVKL